MAFDIDWPHGHKTRGGLPARIIATDIVGQHPIVAAIMTSGGTEEVRTYNLNGQYYYLDNDTDILDLINAEP